MKDKIKNKENSSLLRNEITHLAQNYISSYRATPADLKKYHILRNIKKKTDIIILKPDKGNEVVILDRQVYNEGCMNILNDNSKFKLLSKDPTLSREAKLQRYLRNLKSKGFP